MTVTYESVMNFALQLPPAERSRLASHLWESTRESMRDGGELDAMLDEREAEMDRDPDAEISDEQFMSHFASRSRK